jgi:PelA/Pel-15E family pectate lyase
MKRLHCCLTLALTLTPAFAEPITFARLAELPTTEQTVWKNYLEKSHATAADDKAALEAEVSSNKLPAALKAPSGGDFKLSHQAGDGWYAGDEAKQLADIILSYQAPSGGWSKHLGFSQGPRKPGIQWTSQSEPGQPAHYLATFDNGSTTGEMEFLANVWQATKREDCKAAFVKGLRFIAAAQYPNGGWPQVYPLEGAYHDDVTFNDNAMTNILVLLQGINNSEPTYGFLDETSRSQATAALGKGIECVLNSQIQQNSRKTVWCAQFDALTLQPSNARKMEPASLSGQESARILKFLMGLPHPSPEIINCVDSGLQWFEDVKITGIGPRSVNGKTLYVTDPTSTEVRWARFYDLKSGKPIFPGRDGVLYETFEAMAEKNKLGYDFYTSQPASIVTNGQKKWRKMLEKDPAK